MSCAGPMSKWDEFLDSQIYYLIAALFFLGSKSAKFDAHS